MWEEELLEECWKLLSDVSLQPTSSDGWQWLLDPIGGYPQISPSQTNCYVSDMKLLAPDKNLHQVSWSCIYPVQGDLCFASSMWNISFVPT